MNRLLATLYFFASVGGCGGQPVIQTLNQTVKYVDFSVNIKTHAIQRLGISPSRLKPVANSRFEIFEVLDLVGKTSDEVWIQNKVVYDWNQFKLLLKTPVGSIVLHQRFQPDAPQGNPWDDFQVDETHGEIGERIDSMPGDLVREQTHLIYVFQSRGLVIASYGSNGRLFRIAASHDGLESFWYANSTSDNPFAAYGIPREFNKTSQDPPLNEALRSGMSKITSAIYPSDPLNRVIIAHEFNLSQICSVAEFDKDGLKLGEKLLKFQSRPYDADILNANRTIQ